MKKGELCLTIRIMASNANELRLRKTYRFLGEEK